MLVVKKVNRWVNSTNIFSGKLPLVGVVTATVLIGVGLIALTRAATPAASIELENGLLSSDVTNVSDVGASGGKAIKFGSAVATGSLPFSLSSQTSLKGSPKKVFAHYFTPYPISLDNKAAAQDYYTINYNNPAGESNKFYAYGGFFRQRPLPRPVSAATTWQLDDMKTEVRRATNAGLDGFTLDILSLTGSNYDRMKLLLQAASETDPSFKIVLMPDGTSSATADVNTLASSVAGLASQYNSLYKLADGRLVISPFAPERQGAAYWQNWVTIMKSTYNIDVAFVPCFLNYSANVATFAPFSYGFSNWGNRSPATNQNIATNINDAHARGKIWMQPVSLQDERPSKSVYDEANNTDNFRLTWSGATANNADWIQIPTWNDYSEGAEIAPSTHTGWSPLNLASYYLSKFKFGTAPIISKDVLYVSHRVQLAGATPDPAAGNTSLMQLRVGSSPARDTVEVLSFLKAPGNITVKIGSATYAYAAPAGEFTQIYPLQVGIVTANLSRSGTAVVSVDSPFNVLDLFTAQDEQYHFVSSALSNGIGDLNGN